jgi:hypothetical protein
MKPKKSTKKYPQRDAVQVHHLSYDPEITVKLFKKEHWAITYIDRFNPVSKGFLAALKQYIEDKKDEAIDLDFKKK